MKKQNSIISCSIILMILLTSCDNIHANSGVPTITSHEVRQVPVYDNPETSVPLENTIVHHFNGSSVGYVTLDTFNLLIPELNSVYKSVTNGTNMTITNGIGTCTVDFASQKIIYSNYDGYCIYETNNYTPYMDGLLSGGKSYYVSKYNSSVYDAAIEDKVINLSDYSIPLYFENGVGYFPMEILNQYIYPFGILSISYNGEAIYSYKVTLTAKALEFAQTKDKLDKEYMEFYYNLFALYLDSKFGLDKKGTHEYLVNGAYAALAPYHDRMVSLEANSYDEAMFEFFANELDDGGHTLPTATSALINNKLKLTYGDVVQKGWDRRDQLLAARKAAGYDPSDVVSKQTGVTQSATNCYQEIDGVAYITFDSFVGPTAYPTTIDINNYFTNTIYTVSYANEQIRKNNIKDLVIDIAANGGGLSYVEHFIASWLCGGVSTALRNNVDKTFSLQTHYADVNFDGVYDENDVLPEDVNVYCMTSCYSFSCGNLLPFHLKEQRKTTFIGEKTGGGSCMVAASLNGAFGFSFQMSSCYQLGSISSTSYDNFISVEEGVSPNYPLSTEASEIAGFYDRANIINTYIKKK